MKMVSVNTIGKMYVHDHEGGAEAVIPDHELFVVDFLMKHVKEDSNFMDIGGYCGYFTLLMGQKIKKGVIYTFEPCGVSYEIIKKNIEMHGFNNVKLFHATISNKKSPNAILYWRPGAQCVSRIFTDIPDNNAVIPENIPTFTLDDFIDDNPVKIDLIKIDIESSEVELFKGAKRFFSINKDCKIVLELHCANIRNRGFNLDTFIQDIDNMFNFFDFSMNKLDMENVRNCLKTSNGTMHCIIVPK